MEGKIKCTDLLIGEHLKTDIGADGKFNIIKRLSASQWVDILHGGSVFHEDIALVVTGYEVDVEIKTK